MTNETKFTPAPWFIRADYDDKDVLFIAAGGKIICDLDGKYNKEANAHLIQTAPIMYKHLEIAEKNLVDLWEIYNKDARLEMTGGSIVGSEAERQANQLWIQIEEIRSILKKARGEAC